jgi:protein SCO1/2
MTQKRIAILVLIAVAGFFASYLVGLAIKYSGRLPAAQSTGLMPVTDDAFGGPFTLTDQSGQTVTDKNFTGKYRLIYFGFTYCPAICPTELSKMTAALNTLGDKGKAIVPMFITVDPERDTAEKMKNYVSLFHPSLVGLTGTPEQIKTTLKEYKIYAAKRQDEGMTDYTMDHSSFVYFMDPHDRLLHIFKSEDTADVMADTVSKWLDHQQ